MIDPASGSKKFFETFYVRFEKEDIIFENEEVASFEEVYEDDAYRQIVKNEKKLMDQIKEKNTQSHERDFLNYLDYGM